MGELFGTDGIRGRANQYPMTPEMVVKVGRAVAAQFAAKSRKDAKEAPKVVIGRDTRVSGHMLEGALVSGICAAGCDACLAGVLPTPGIAFLTSKVGAVAGIVISASHNPYFDNGIKVFDPSGYKLSDSREEEIEKCVLRENAPADATLDVGRAFAMTEAVSAYTDFLVSTLPDGMSFKKMKIVLDCANGATYQTAPLVFKKLGADVETIFAEPDGFNINQDCGSQHPEQLQRRVLEANADVGLAFDGDGDRLIAVDETGRVATGDQLLAACGAHLKRKNQLQGDSLVTTVMSNMGLGVALEKLQIRHFMSAVGDRHVMELMKKKGASVGGEDSGHMIFLDHHTTGDGILAALVLLTAMADSGKPLSSLISVMDVFPQELINVDVREKPDLKGVPKIMEVIRAVETELGSQGRVLVRYSGTQPMCRVMVEGPSPAETRSCCERIASVIRDCLG